MSDVVLALWLLFARKCSGKKWSRILLPDRRN